MPQDKITQIRIASLRCIEQLTLDLGGITVLIGDNGSGKSTIIEAMELLRLAAKAGSFVNDIIQRKHGGLQNLLNFRATQLVLGATVEGAGPPLQYELIIARQGSSAIVSGETIVDAELRPILHRIGREVTWQERLTSDQGPREVGDTERIDDSTLALSRPAMLASPSVRRVAAALEAIEVQVPFETRPSWQLNERPNFTYLRMAVAVENVKRLDRFGDNLANCFYTLHNGSRDVWDRVLGRVHLGLGAEISDIQFPASRRGAIEMVLVSSRFPDQVLPLDVLSEGQIAYLCFVAAAEFGVTRSLIAFDEPELHLNPALLMRVLRMVEDVAEHTPVLVSTHSDALLDALEDPAKSVVLCELDENGATQLRRPDPQSLADWLSRYRGVGDVRANGYEAHLFEPRAASHGGDK